MVRASPPGSTRAPPASAARRSGTMTFSLPRSGFMSSIIPLEVDERPLDHPHLVALLEDRLELGLLGALLHLAQDRVDLLAGQRDRLAPPSPRTRSPSASSARGARCRRSSPSRPARSPGRTSARSRSLLPLANLDAPSRSGSRPGRSVSSMAEDLGPRLDRLRHLVLEPRVGVDDEPLLLDMSTCHRQDQSTIHVRAMIHDRPETRPGRAP